MGFSPSRITSYNVCYTKLLRLGVNVLAIRRGEITLRKRLSALTLQEGDWLVIIGERDGLDSLQKLPDFRLINKEMLDAYELPESLLVVRIPEGSPIMGKSLSESHLGQTFGLKALSLIRDDQVQIMPGPDIKLEMGVITSYSIHYTKLYDPFRV